MKFQNVVFNNPVKFEGSQDSVCFEDCTFKAMGSGQKDSKTPSIDLYNANGEVLIHNCTFEGQGYTAINVRNSSATISNNRFNCANYYNPIECTVSAGNDISKVDIVGNTFEGKCGNNYMNFYKMAENAEINIVNNDVVDMGGDAEVIRISNPNNVNAQFNVEDLTYNFAEPVGEYGALIMTQDYTSKSGNPQDFTKISIGLSNVYCNKRKIVNQPVAGKLHFTYVDGVGMDETNVPNISIVNK